MFQQMKNNIFTKLLSRNKFESMRNMLQIQSLKKLENHECKEAHSKLK
jgi:hypothetical protein